MKTNPEMKMLAAVAAAFLVRYMATGFGLNAEGINSMALQQGGLGLILTTLIIMTPPMAAAFFQGTLGHFSSYAGFGVVGRGTGVAGRTPGQPGYQGSATYAPRVQAAQGAGWVEQFPQRPEHGYNPATIGAYTGSYVSHADQVKTGPRLREGVRHANESTIGSWLFVPE